METVDDPVECKTPRLTWVLFVLGIGVLVLLAVDFPVASHIAWAEDLTSAQQTARQRRTGVFMQFTGAGCVFCARMKREVLTLPEIEVAINQFVPVTLDAWVDSETASRFHVDGVPAYVVMDPDGGVLARAVGYLPAAEFKRFLQYASARVSERFSTVSADR